ncbi:MAG: hypothetical protein LAO20_04995 [Acidobacteriia bacterium]|nr:hypothetical protein [Terriglobia bacterium]
MFRFEDAAKSRVSVGHSHDGWKITIAKRANRSKFGAAMPLVIFVLIACLALSDPGVAFRTLFLLSIPGVACVGLFLHTLRTDFEEDTIAISSGMLTLRRIAWLWKSERTIPLSEVRGVRMSKGWSFGLVPELLLECQRRSYSFGQYLSEDEAMQVVAEVRRHLGTTFEA